MVDNIQEKSTSHLASLLCVAEEQSRSVYDSLHEEARAEIEQIEAEFVRRDRLLGLVSGPICHGPRGEDD